MSESQKYKLKYDELRESNPAKNENAKADTSETEDKSYPSAGNVRNLCFAWPDGRRQFFNYAYLVSGELNVGNEMNVITLRFTSDIVTLKGYGLAELFSQLVGQIPSLIVQSDERYAQEDDAYSLIDISVMPIT